MNRTRIASAIAVAAVLGTSAVALAAGPPKLDMGKFQYESNCAVCHGKAGKGDGPFAGKVDTKAGADITQLAKRNAGVFPFARVYEVIDGRQEVKYHGTRDMPIWGSDYQAKALADSGDMPCDAEMFVRARIVALTDYIYRLQAK
jgi:mono/diheme cytochrome c family protein